MSWNKELWRQSPSSVQLTEVKNISTSLQEWGWKVSFIYLKNRYQKKLLWIMGLPCDVSKPHTQFKERQLFFVFLHFDVETMPESKVTIWHSYYWVSVVDALTSTKIRIICWNLWVIAAIIFAAASMIAWIYQLIFFVYNLFKVLSHFIVSNIT